MDLPVQLKPFVGRARELQVATNLVETHRIVTLVGAGGSGKTRLAVEVAQLAAECFVDGVHWVPLAPVHDPRLVEQTIARSVGAPGPLIEHLAKQRVLLVIDNAEHVVDPAFVERETIDAICSRVDRLPLAVELAATRVNVLTLDALLARLERRLPLLTSGERDVPDRHQTLRATIAWSEDLLPQNERELFRHLAIFPASFDLRAAEQVCSADLAAI